MRIIMALILMFCSAVSFAANTEQERDSAIAPRTVQYHAGIGTIDMAGLKALMHAHSDIVIIDTNIDDWFTGVIIPGAIRLNQEDSDAKILATLPNKEKVLITYCGSYQCPASKNFAKHLIDLGYENVLHYPGGIEEWYKKGNSIDKMPIKQ